MWCCSHHGCFRLLCRCCLMIAAVVKDVAGAGPLVVSLVEVAVLVVAVPVVAVGAVVGVLALGACAVGARAK